MILELFLTYIPIIVAFFGECAIIKWAISAIKKRWESNDIKEVIEQNKVLVSELREERKLNRQLLTKIDRIQRKED